ncbi:PREDICTED: uncharacterized protein LOC104612234 [Nelumbo nucifera]|uniref:Uncharacterized protein n=2 Tax=Nelumbo nucifera TaxID=4432 RepID=A0A822XK31_NELNU|nr:PREDICTED: uncharacterized protein LOC104612234 [Nelumbo nucifera]DAD20730.1 TPA_asm: hypothetical protein HUJ06_022193 [Nelumbo nucifera]
MEISVGPWNSSNGNGGRDEDPDNKSPEEREMKQPGTMNKRGRKCKNGPTQKKPPQRGLGVAQLERLRLQERWKMMTEMDPFLCQSLKDQAQFQFSFPFVNQQPSGISAPLSGLGPTNYAGPNSSLLSSHTLAYYSCSVGNGGISGVPVASGVRPVYYSQRFEADRSRIGSHERRFQNGHSIESRKELSSIQTMHGLSDEQSYLWAKYKKHSNGDNLEYGGAGRHRWVMPIDDRGFLGLDLGCNRNLDGERGNVGDGAGGARLRLDRPKVHEEAKVLAVQRKGRTVIGEVVMEYDFFPCSEGGGGDRRKMEMNNNGWCSTQQTEGSSSSSSSAATSSSRAGVVVGEASTSRSAHFLDLSLKLSC